VENVLMSKTFDDTVLSIFQSRRVLLLTAILYYDQFTY